jgi:hypothetical protein
MHAKNSTCFRCAFPPIVQTFSSPKELNNFITINNKNLHVYTIAKTDLSDKSSPNKYILSFAWLKNDKSNKMHSVQK